MKKQIDEMRYLADEMGKEISTAVEQRYLTDERKLEAVLKENGWRKASEVSEKIFTEIEAIIRRHDERPKYQLMLDLAELKNKYTEDGE